MVPALQDSLTTCLFHVSVSALASGFPAMLSIDYLLVLGGSFRGVLLSPCFCVDTSTSMWVLWLVLVCPYSFVFSNSFCCKHCPCFSSFSILLPQIGFLQTLLCKFIRKLTYGKAKRHTHIGGVDVTIHFVLYILTLSLFFLTLQMCFQACYLYSFSIV